LEAYWSDLLRRIATLLDSGRRGRSRGAGRASGGAASPAVRLEALLPSLRCLLADARVLRPDHRALGSLLETAPLERLPEELSYRVAACLVEFAGSVGRVREALELAERVLPSGAPVLSPAAARLARFKGEMLLRVGEVEEASRLQGQARGVFACASMPLEEAQCLNNLGTIELHRGRIAAACSAFHEALARIGSRSAPVLCGHIQNNLGVAAAMRGESVEAEGCFQRALVHRRRGRDAPGVAETLYNLCLVSLRERRLDEARERFGPAWELAERLRLGVLLAHLRVARAEIFLAAEDPRPAQRLLAEAERLYAAQGNGAGRAEVLRLRGELAARRGRVGAARAAFEEAIRLCRRAGYGLGEAQALERLAELDLAAGRLAASHAGLERALEIYRGLGARIDASRVERRLLAGEPG